MLYYQVLLSDKMLIPGVFILTKGTDQKFNSQMTPCIVKYFYLIIIPRWSSNGFTQDK